MAKRNLIENIDPSMAREYFSYDAKSGELRWRKTDNRKIAIGALAGCPEPSAGGRIKVGFRYRKIRAHIIIWAYQMGKWPTKEVDHINHDPSDNRWSNLREATKAENMWNMRTPKRNKSGSKGVFYDRRYRHPWLAKIRANNKIYTIGRFDTKKAATDAYQKASRKLHGKFSIHNQIRPSAAKR